MPDNHKIGNSFRRYVLHGLSLAEDVVYAGIGFLLVSAALALLFSGFKSFLSAAMAHALAGQFVNLLDQVLLILLVIELLYTVQVSFREHGLIAEPFMVVALIAVIRRILVVTAESSHLPEVNDTIFHRSVIELGLLSFMVVVLVASLIALQRQPKAVASENHASTLAD